MMRNAFLIVAVVVALARPALAAPPPPTRPLAEILLDLDDAPLSVVKKVADLQAKEQFQVDKGPLYKSAPAMLNSDPKKMSDEVIFEGTIMATTGGSKLALFSDDGCDVWIDGVLVLNNMGKGQHLPDLKQSLHVLDKFKPVAGRTYQVKIHYCNTIYNGKNDIDGCTLFAFAGGAQPEPPSLLDIYYPQNGAQVPNKDKFTVGSFTVVNINCTDGAAKLDKKDNPIEDIPDQEKPKVLVASANLTEAATKGGKTLTLDKTTNLAKDFPFLVNNIKSATKIDLVYSAPNRIRITDDVIKAGHNGELAYIKSIDEKANTITLAAPLKDSYNPKQGGRIEIGEVDLMRLVVHAPPQTKEKAITIRLVKGNAKLWESENKVKEFELKKGKGPGLEAEISVKDLPKALWIEARVASLKDEDIVKELTAQGVRGIVFKAEAGKDTDMVSATGVWATRTIFANSGNKLKGDPQGVVLKTFTDNFNGSLGLGYFNGDFPKKDLFIGGRVEHEFTLLPPGVGKEPAVIADAARQAAGFAYVIKLGEFQRIAAALALPQIGWNISEVATDDEESRPSILEDNSKSKDHVYNIDFPSFGSIQVAEEEGGLDFIVRRFNAEDFVRFKFGPTEKFNSTGVAVEGSRGSLRKPWHLLTYARRGHGVLADQKPGPFVDETVKQGKIENPQAFLPDLDKITASVPQLFSRKEIKDKNGKLVAVFGVAKGNGTMSVPNVKDKTLSDQGITAGWRATFKGNDKWQFLAFRTTGGKNFFFQDEVFDINKDNKTWTLRTLFGDKKTLMLEVTITKGTQAFAEGDTFQFGVFRSVHKKNEVEEGLIDLNAEESQYQAQQK